MILTEAGESESSGNIVRIEFVLLSQFLLTFQSSFDAFGRSVLEYNRRVRRVSTIVELV